MEIRIRMMGIFKDRTPPSGCLQLPEGATIEDVLRRLEIPLEMAQVFTVNGQVERDRTRTLLPGDELMVLPPVAGG
jgi:molybdopterin converting factor small subunit